MVKTNISKIESKSALQRVTDLCAWGVILLAGVVLLGWFSGVRPLANVFTEYVVPMAISAAVSFIVMGSLLLWQHHLQAKHNLFFAIAFVLFAAFHFINLLGYLISNGNMAVDAILFPTNEVLQTFPVNRMSPIASATFFIGALAIYLLSRAQASGGTAHSAALLGFVVFEVGSISLIGYAYGTPLLYGGSTIPLALTAALAFTFLGVGLVAAAGANNVILRLFSGPLLRARLLRTFLPISVLLILAQGYLHQYLHEVNINPALWNALMSMLFAALMGVSITFVGRFVEQAVDRAQVERQKADEHLRESESRYRDLVENSQDLICTHDMEGRLLTINPAATRLLGYDLRELIGSNIRDHLVPEMRERFSGYISQIKQDGAASGLLFMQTKSGERRIWEYNNTVRTEGMTEPIVRGMARDITERKRAEESLKLFRTLVDQSSDAIEVLDLETGRFLDVNERGYLELGYSREEFLALSVFDVDPIVDQSTFQKAKEELRKSGFMMWEGIHQRKDGSTFPVEVNLKYVRVDREYIVSAARDITERKLAEQSLRESQAQLEGIFNSTMDAIVTIDSDQRIIIFNTAAERMFGVSSGEAIGQTLDRFIPENVRQDHRKFIHAFSESDSTKRSMENPTIALTCLRANGEAFPSEISISHLVEIGGRDLYTAIIRDITERKQAEEALRDSENLLRESQLIANMGSYVLDISTGLWRSSDVLDKLFGIDEGYERTVEGWAKLIHPDDRTMMVDYFRNEVLSQGQTFDKEYRIIRHDDQAERWVHGLGKLEFDAQGHPLKMYGAIQDVTERKQAQDALQHQANELSAIYESARRLQQLRAPDALAGEIIFSLEHILNYTFGAILLIEEGTGRLLPFSVSDQGHNGSFSSIDAAYISSREPRVGKGLTGWVAQSGKAVCSGDVTKDSRYYAVRQDIRSELCVPLHINDQIIGVVNVESIQPNAYSESDQRVLETIAAQIATAIQNSRLYDQVQQELAERKRAELALRKRIEAQRALADVTNAIAAKLDMAELLDLLLERMLTHLHNDMSNVLLLDQSGDKLINVATRGARQPEAMLGFGIKIGQGGGGWVTRHNQPLAIPDIQQDSRWFHDDISRSEGIVSWLGIPLQIEGRVIGVLNINMRARREFTADEIEFSSALAGQAAIAIQNARLYQEAQKEIAERKKAEEQLRKLSIAVEQSPTSIVITNTRGEIEYVNPKFKDLSGYSAAEIIGQNSRILKSGYTSDDEYKNLWQTISNGAEWRGKFLNKKKNGELYWESASISPIINETGETTHYLAVKEDITEREHREQELEAIAAITVALRAAPTRKDMLPIILDQLHRLFRSDSEAITLRDPLTDELVLELGRGDFTTAIGHRLPSGQGVSGLVIQSGQPYLSNDARHDPNFVRKDILQGINAFACVPLITHDTTLGILWIGRATDITQAEVRVLVAIADIAANAIQRAALHEQTAKQLERLSALRTIDTAIGNSFDLRVILNIFIDQVLSQLNVSAASVLISKGKFSLEYAAGSGFRNPAIKKTRLRFGEGHAGHAALERRSLFIPDLSQEPFPAPNFLAGEGFVSYYAAPLIAKGEVKGVLQIFHRAPLSHDEEWFDFVQMLAGQAAIAIDNAALFDHLQQSNAELITAYDATIEGWSRALDLRDQETEGHTQRVTEIALNLAVAMSVEEKDILHIRRGALLHDIGKMGVPDAILLKPGPLNNDEWAIMMRHPQYAFEMLSSIPFLQAALDIPYCHHEKWDGTGYPRRLKGEQIPLVARLFAIVDVWDAITSDRPYRAAWLRDKAITYIREQSGKHFEPRVVEEFLKMIET